MYPEGKGSHGRHQSGHRPADSHSAPVRRIVGLVVFDGEKFLLLHRVLNWRGWEFPKGHIMDGESIEDARARELFEETGIPKHEVVGKIDEVNYFDNVRKNRSLVHNFLVRVSSNNRITFEHQSMKDGKLVSEHDDFKWCFPAEAVKMLKHKNMKQTMRNAVKMLGLSMEK